MITTQSTNPFQERNEYRAQIKIQKPEEGLEGGCAQEIPFQIDVYGAFLQGSVE